MDPLVWPAHWISPGAHPREDLGVFGFRVRLELASVPPSLMVRVSADQRYKLYVNGEMVMFGPQRGDEKHWFYETVDIAPFLNEGENWIAAFVWNFGRWAPMAQHTVRTGFVFCCDDSSSSSVAVLNTPGDWQVMRIPGWDFEMMHSSLGDFYIDVGPGEVVDFNKCPTAWDIGHDNDECNWQKPNVICQAEERGASGGGMPWMLIPRSIPDMEYEHVEFDSLSNTRCYFTMPGSGTYRAAIRVEGDYHIGPESSLLVDFGQLICGYPDVILTAEEGAEIRITYSEALWDDSGGKGNRNELDGKRMRGYQDLLISNGKPLSFEPLWWRTFRFIQIDCSKPAHLLWTQYLQTGYPLQVESSFTADDPWVEKIWDVSIRTAKRCAGETYFDCPYYEQLQYVGDTRIQAVIGYYLGRDRALQRNAVETLGWSIMDNGLTQSRYPSRQAQVIPPFSLWWVMMLYDQMLYDRAERKPLDIQPYQQGQRVLDGWMALHDQPEFWQFTDWVPEWRAGVPRETERLPIDNALRMLVEAATNHMGFDQDENSAWPAKLIDKEFSGPYADISMNWNELLDSEEARAAQQGFFFADPSATSEHFEAILRQLPAMVGRDPAPWPTEALAAANASKCTYYFSYYKHLAMFGRPDNLHPQPPPPPGHKSSRQEERSRESDLRRSDNPQPTIHNPQSDYLTELQPWKEMVEQGLTTFAENPEPTRSDCHAWSAHPILGFFQIVAGVTSIAPGWKKAQIMPHPGDLKRFDARIAHPDGELKVAYENEKFSIDSPIPFRFRWRDEDEEFSEGQHEIG